MPASFAATGAVQSVVLSILPVILFLAGLTLMDSYRLVRPRSVVGSVSVGVLAALVALMAARAFVVRLGWDHEGYAGFTGPVVEETLKACYVAFLVATRRAGFMVDAAVHGFAVGAGFAVVENLSYLHAIEASVPLAAARGLGTAIMHGGTTAVLGIAAKRFIEIRGTRSGVGLAAGLAAAVALHVLYNRAVVYPVVSTLSVVVLLPIVFAVFFGESERSLRSWLGTGFDTDAEMLEMMEGGGIADSRIGMYLSSLRESLSPEVVADMLCMMRLRVELSVRAKGILLMREAGFEAPVDPEVKDRFEELRYLEHSVGRTGMLAMLPLLSWRHRDLWEMHMLAGRRRRA